MKSVDGRSEVLDSSSQACLHTRTPSTRAWGRWKAPNLETRQAEPLPKICPISVTQFVLEAGLCGLGSYLQWLVKVFPV